MRKHRSSSSQVKRIESAHRRQLQTPSCAVEDFKTLRPRHRLCVDCLADDRSDHGLGRQAIIHLFQFRCFGWQLRLKITKKQTSKYTISTNHVCQILPIVWIASPCLLKYSQEPSFGWQQFASTWGTFKFHTNILSCAVSTPIHSCIPFTSVSVRVSCLLSIP